MHFVFSTNDVFVRHVYINPVVYKSRVGIDIVCPDTFEIPPNTTCQLDTKLRVKCFSSKWPMFRRRRPFLVLPKPKYNNLIISSMIVNPDYAKCLKLTVYNIGTKDVRLDPGDRIAVLVAPNFHKTKFSWAV